MCFISINKINAFFTMALYFYSQAKSMKCLYKLTLFKFIDQQEHVRESTSNTCTSRKRKRFSANDEGQDLVEIERQRGTK